MSGVIKLVSKPKAVVPEIVEALEKLLVKAQNGEVSTLAYALTDAEGEVHFNALIRSGDKCRAVAMVTFLHHRVLRGVMNTEEPSDS